MLNGIRVKGTFCVSSDVVACGLPAIFFLSELNQSHQCTGPGGDSQRWRRRRQQTTAPQPQLVEIAHKCQLAVCPFLGGGARDPVPPLMVETVEANALKRMSDRSEEHIAHVPLPSPARTLRRSASRSAQGVPSSSSSTIKHGLAGWSQKKKERATSRLCPHFFLFFFLAWPPCLHCCVSLAPT